MKKFMVLTDYEEPFASVDTTAVVEASRYQAVDETYVVLFLESTHE